MPQPKSYCQPEMGGHNPLAVRDIPTVAAHLGVSTSTVRRLLADGVLPHHRIGKRIVFTSDDLEKFLSACAKPARSVEQGGAL